MGIGLVIEMFQKNKIFCSYPVVTNFWKIIGDEDVLIEGEYDDDW